MIETTAQIYKVDDDEYEIHVICNGKVVTSIGWGDNYKVKSFCGGYKITMNIKDNMVFHSNVDDYVCLTWM